MAGEFCTSPWMDFVPALCVGEFCTSPMDGFRTRPMVIKYYRIKFMKAASAAAVKATTEAAAAKKVAAAEEAAAGPNYRLRKLSGSKGERFYYGGQKYFFVLFKMVKLIN